MQQTLKRRYKERHLFLFIVQDTYSLVRASRSPRGNN